MIELQVESAPVAKHEDVIALANDLAKQLATGPGAKTPEELWKQPAPSRKGMTLQQWKDEIEGKMREVFRLARIIRIDAPTGGYVHHDAKSGVLLEVEGGNDELAKEHCHARRRHAAEGHHHGRARSRRSSTRNAPSSPSRPARKASRTTSSKR